MTAAPKLVVEGLELGYRSERTREFSLACSDLSFRVEENEFVAIVGPSGCGKTTFLSAVSGLVPVSSGRLELQGRQISGPGPDRALVFQQASLFPWRTVRKNIMFGLEAQGRADEAGRKRVDDLLDLVGLGDKGDKHPRELSGGMSQRVNLARALATDPELLLLDEPFAALDAQTREVMQEELTRVWQADGPRGRKTAVFITHDVPEAVFLADRVIVFSRGPARVVECVDVDLPRPRDAAVKKSARYVELIDYVRDLVMQQGVEKKGATGGGNRVAVA